MFLNAKSVIPLLLIGSAGSVLLATLAAGALFSSASNGHPLFLAFVALGIGIERAPDLLLAGAVLLTGLAVATSCLGWLRWPTLVCGTSVVVAALGTVAVLRVSEEPASDFEAAWLRVPGILLLAGFGAGLAYACFVGWLERSVTVRSGPDGYSRGNSMIEHDR
jgi:hypothetical protein